MSSLTTISLPASKSICNRVLIINALLENAYTIGNLSDCDDTQVMLQALTSKSNHFDIGAAGTAMRFLTAFLAQKTGEYTITGSARMKQRPIKILVSALRSVGANIEYMEEDGFPPLKISGKALQGGTLMLDGSVSSQYISALMMIAPCMTQGLRIELQGDIVSMPYLKMTHALMENFGVKVQFEPPVIDIRPQQYAPVKYTVENDWSSAAFWYEWLSVVGKGELFLPHLYKNSLQGDSKVADIFKQLGISTIYQENGVLLTANGHYAATLDYDFINQPDLAQSVVVTCCLRNIPFNFSGLQTLKIKETDRIAALIAELRKLGFVLRDAGNGCLQWDGTRCAEAQNITIETYDDHRMAMAFAVAQKKYTITIAKPEVVSKSYPNFWEEFGKL